MALPDWLPLVKEKVRDTAAKLTDVEIIHAIDQAVKEYSRSKPRDRLFTIIGNGATWTYTLPADWEIGFSAVLAVEHPVGEQKPVYLDGDEFTVRLQPDETYRLHLFVTLAALETAQVIYRTRHRVVAGEDTVPLNDRDAVCSLAASKSCRQLATYYTQTSDATLLADAVNYRTKGDEYEARAKALEKDYRLQVGLEGGSAIAANVNQDLDVAMAGWFGVPGVGYDRFYHSKRNR